MFTEGDDVIRDEWEVDCVFALSTHIYPLFVRDMNRI